jgi:D-aminopeptidase
VIVVTDAPLEPASCARLARRAGLGLARTGSTAHHGSGEIFLAMATGLRAPRGGLAQEPGPEQASGRSQEGSSLAAAMASQITGSALDPFFDAVVEATEEAVLNSMLTAPTVTGRDGNTSPGLPAARVAELLIAAGRIAAATSGSGRPE